MLSLAWFVLRAAFWLGLLSLFVPGTLPFQTNPARPAESVVESTARDTLTSEDRAVAWRGPRPTNTNVRQARRAR